MTKELIEVFIYKGKQYEDCPLSVYHIDKVEEIDKVKYIYVRRKIPMYIHLTILCLLLIPLLKLNYDSFNKESVQVREHVLRVPSEMYYDASTKILDIDLTNDSSNFEIVSFNIQDSSGKNIISLNGINPGESIGSLPVEYKFNKLPSNCKIIYKTTYGGYVFKDIELNVLIVDTNIADKDINNDF